MNANATPTERKRQCFQRYVNDRWEHHGNGHTLRDKAELN
jgi:hypothetical protein